MNCPNQLSKKQNSGIKKYAVGLIVRLVVHYRVAFRHASLASNKNSLFNSHAFSLVSVLEFDIVINWYHCYIYWENSYLLKGKKGRTVLILLRSCFPLEINGRHLLLVSCDDFFIFFLLWRKTASSTLNLLTLKMTASLKTSVKRYPTIACLNCYVFINMKLKISIIFSLV